MLQIEHIINEVIQLNKEDQITLLTRLEKLVDRQPDSDIKLSSISGIGADLWSGINIDTFIENERIW